MARPSISLIMRRQVIERAAGCCEYCRNQQKFSTAPFSVEHIIARSNQGNDDLSNLALSCPACNAHKYTKEKGFDPLSRKYHALYHPRMQVWQDHFTWDETSTILLGITPIGRATIQALNMNRTESVNLRSVLVLFGEHPPA